MKFVEASIPEANHAQEKLDLLTLLDVHNIPHHTWTEQKTIDDLAAEVRAGESVLKVNEDGELRRHTAVVWVDAFATNDEGKRVHLREDRQKFNDGRPVRGRKGLPASLGEKLLVGNAKPESPVKGAWRALDEELGVKQVAMLGLMGTAQRESEASSYPGLTTIYTDHFFATEVPFEPDGYQEVQANKTTYFEWEPPKDISGERFEVVLNRIRGILPTLAADLVLGYQDMPANKSFAENPDNPDEHAPLWHQYGILTHSEKFRESLVNDIPQLVEEWGIGEAVTAALDESIDGVTKESLLQIAALLHDIGKFTARADNHFEDHEADSGKIVREGLKETLYDLGCSEAQIEYVASCAELHFELGKVRRETRETGGGFTLEFARSDAAKQTMENIIAEHPGYALEIGLMFIADSLSKTEVAATEAADDDGIAAQKETLEAEIRDKGLSPNLIKQALQLPVNLAVAKKYLSIWARQPS